MSKYLACLLVFGGFLSACTFSLAEDVKPPPGYQPQPVVEQTASAPNLLYPLVAPDPEDGKVIFLEKCAPCHGETGLGDGERAKDLPNPVTAIGLSEVVRAASPVAWFNIVTQGNLQQSMPPFTSLTDRQRWDVVAYAFLLSGSRENFVEGKRIYLKNCSACHGLDGKGVGQQLIDAKLPDFSHQEYMVGKSTSDFFSSISAGVAPAMPSFAEKLTEEERWSVAGYLRTFSLSEPAVIGMLSTPYPGLPYPQPEPGPASQSQTGAAQPTVYPGVTTELGVENPITSTAVISHLIGKISGVVSNGSGGTIPIGGDVMLHAYDQMQLVITTTAQINPDGSYNFDPVTFAPDRAFFTTLDYANVTYSSDLLTVKSGQANLQLPIQVFDATTDVGVLVADRVHLFIDPSQQDALQIVELFIISNNSSKTLVSAEQGQPVVAYDLPPNAFDLKFQDGQIGGKYSKTKNGFGDFTPIRPGSGAHQVLYSYQLSYDRKLDFVRLMPMDAQAVIVLVPEIGLKVSGVGLQDAGIRDVEGTRYRMYSGSALNKGESLNLTISGRPSIADIDQPLFSNNDLVIGLGVLGIVLISAGVWLFGLERNKNRQVKVEQKPVAQVYDSPDTVMDAILTLDDLFQDGQLPEEAYLQRRGELKALLRELLQKHD